MCRMTAPARGMVSRHFDATASDWRDLYAGEDIYSRLYQYRRTVVLDQFQRLGQPARSRVLEVGCGPGMTAVEMARRGHDVTALDVAPAMIDLTRKLASDKGVELRTLVGDLMHLPFPDDSFPTVLAVGVMEWAEDMEAAIHQLARVLAPGGRLIVTFDNRWALNRLLDPALHPALDPFKRLLRRSERKARPRVYSWRTFNAAAGKAGLRVLSGSTLGFGPFSLVKYPVLSGRMAFRFHEMLQTAADRGIPFVRGAGHVYAVVARK